MPHVFLEFDIDPGVKTVSDLTYVLRHEAGKQTAYAISAEVAKFVQDALIVNETIISFKNCCFAFRNGAEFVTFDNKGKSKRFSDPIPAWFIRPGEFVRSTWLRTHELADLRAPDFVNAFIEMFPDLKERRHHADLLFDLKLEKTKAKAESVSPPTGKPGNKNRITTKPKVADLGSFEIFSHFFERLKTAVNNDTFPTLQVLTGHDDITRVPNSLKGSVRTWFKAVTGELPPNNKRVGAGNAVLFCAPIREQIRQVESWGLEEYYQKLSQAIAEAGETYIADFTFRVS
ncbi:hypothetical protein [Franconibacter helveticus]|uniref:hypothetical protein n=1 Tax=Franconibacter helveticus TaxID=357240 RepID=UPI000DA1D93A|nr:hypothetical protein [Franconibacter helveticus]